MQDPYEPHHPQGDGIPMQPAWPQWTGVSGSDHFQEKCEAANQGAGFTLPTPLQLSSTLICCFAFFLKVVRPGYPCPLRPGGLHRNSVTLWMMRFVRILHVSRFSNEFWGCPCGNSTCLMLCFPLVSWPSLFRNFRR